MATQTVQPGCAPANPIVEAYLTARAAEGQADQDCNGADDTALRMAQFTHRGAADYAISWGIHDPQHAALVALLAANRLESLVEGYAVYNDRMQRVVTFGTEELYELKQVTDALLNLWRHLDGNPRSKLEALALDMGLIDKNGTSVR